MQLSSSLEHRTIGVCTAHSAASDCLFFSQACGQRDFYAAAVSRLSDSRDAFAGGFFANETATVGGESQSVSDLVSCYHAHQERGMGVNG